MIVPEKSHFLFERAPSECHPGKPPSLQLAPVESWKVERVRETETVPDQIVQSSVVYLFIVDEKVDRTFPSTGDYVIYLVRASAEAHSPKKMSCLII